MLRAMSITSVCYKKKGARITVMVTKKTIVDKINIPEGLCLFAIVVANKM